MAAKIRKCICRKVFRKKRARLRKGHITRRRLQRAAATDVHGHQRLPRLDAERRRGKVCRFHAELKPAELKQPQRQMVRQPRAFRKTDPAAVVPVFRRPAADVADCMIKHLVRNLPRLVFGKQLPAPKERCKQIGLRVATPEQRLGGEDLGSLGEARKQRRLKAFLIKSLQTLTGIFLPRKGNRLFDVVHFVPNL